MDLKGVVFILLVIVLAVAVVMGVLSMFGPRLFQGGDDDEFEGAADHEVSMVTKVYGSLSEKAGKAEANGHGKIVGGDYTDLTTNGNFALDDVKVKKTLTINGYTRCYRLNADTVEVSGGAFITDSDVKHLVVHNQLIPGQKPGVTVVGSKIGDIKLSDKSAKESDLVLVREKGSEPPKRAMGKKPARAAL